MEILETDFLNKELEAVNDLSEEAIREEYCTAAVHGPRWYLGLDGKPI
jgi:hypothetical protein